MIIFSTQDISSFNEAYFLFTNPIIHMIMEPQCYCFGKNFVCTIEKSNGPSIGDYIFFIFFWRSLIISILIIRGRALKCIASSKTCKRRPRMQPLYALKNSPGRMSYRGDFLSFIESRALEISTLLRSCSNHAACWGLIGGLDCFGFTISNLLWVALDTFLFFHIFCKGE